MLRRIRFFSSSLSFLDGRIRIQVKPTRIRTPAHITMQLFPYLWIITLGETVSNNKIEMRHNLEQKVHASVFLALTKDPDTNAEVAISAGKYSKSKKSCPFISSQYSMNIGQHFLDIHQQNRYLGL